MDTGQTDRWRQQEETHSTYTNLSNVARDTLSMILHDVAVESSFSLGRDVIGSRQSTTTGEIICKKVIVRHFARANNGILEGAEPELDTRNTNQNSEVTKEVQERKLHTMAKVHDFLEMWQGNQNLCAKQKESNAQNMQMTAVELIPDTEDIFNASWSLFLHHCVAASKLIKRSPLTPALTAKNLPRG